MGKEDIPNKIEVSEEEVIKILKERGIHDIDSMTLLDRWTEQEVAKIEVETRNTEKDPTDWISFDRRQAKIYFEAGFAFQAIVALKHAAWSALSSGDSNLCEEIWREIWNKVRRIEEDGGDEIQEKLYKKIIKEVNRTEEF